MRILVFNWQDIKNPLGGGAEGHFHEIFRRIAARGHEVTLLCSTFPGAPREETIDGITVLRDGGRNLFNFTVRKRYRKDLAAQRFDVVVDDLNKIPFFTPLFVAEPLVTIVHHLFGGSIFHEAFFPAAAYVWAMESAAMKVYRKVRFAAVSPSTQRELEDRGIPHEHIHLVFNAVDQELFRPAAQRHEGSLTVGYLGRIKKYKSVDHLVRAFAEVVRSLPEAKLIVVGDGDALASLRRTASELGIQRNVEFTGYVSPEEKVRLLQNMDLVVNPSSKEGWGLTVIEANACGVPVIASDVPGLKDSVLDGSTGMLYPYGDVQRLSEMIVKLLTDAPTRRRMSDEAVRWARRFSWAASADAMLAVMEIAVKQGRSRSRALV